MKLSWLYCPSVGRMCTWIGDTKHVVVTGLEGVDVRNTGLSFDLPPSARVFHVEKSEADKVAARLGGVVFVVFASQRSEPLPTTDDDLNIERRARIAARRRSGQHCQVEIGVCRGFSYCRCRCEGCRQANTAVIDEPEPPDYLYGCGDDCHRPGPGSYHQERCPNRPDPKHHQGDHGVFNGGMPVPGREHE